LLSSPSAGTGTGAVVAAATCEVGGVAVVAVVGSVVAGRVVVVRGGRVVVVRGGCVVGWVEVDWVVAAVVEVRGGRVVVERGGSDDAVGDCSVDAGAVVREIDGLVASEPESEQPLIATRASATAPSRNDPDARTRSSWRPRRLRHLTQPG
jgi:hypothetical protein